MLKLEYIRNHKKQLLITGIIVVICIIAGIFIKNKLVFGVVGSSPKNGGSAPVEIQEVVISFSQNLKTDPMPTVDYDGNPDVVFLNGLRVDKNKLIVGVKSLDVNGKYSFVIKNITSVSGKHIPEYKFFFTGKYVSFDRLDDKTKDASIKNDDKTSYDPIYDHLPYEDVNTSISGVTFKDDGGITRTVITVVISLSNADLGSDGGVSAFEGYKASALKYLNSFGIDLKKYTIEYEQRMF